MLCPRSDRTTPAFVKIYEPDLVGFINENVMTIQIGMMNAQLVHFSNDFPDLSPILLGLTPADVQVVATSDDDISVTATFAYQPMSPIISRFGIGTDSSAFFTFNAQSTMRAL